MNAIECEATNGLGRLTSASDANHSLSWAYDGLGRVTSKTQTIGTVASTVGYAYSNGDLTQLTTPSGQSIAYSYLASGQVAAYAGLTFSYAGSGRVSAVSALGVTTNYVLNALGQRVKKSTGAMSTLFVYDEAGHLLGEYDGTGNLIEETVWMGDIPVATLQPNGSGAINVFYVHTDHLNTPRRITRPSDNAMMWRWDSDPFGTTAPNENPSGLGAFNFNLRFPGQYYDVESSLAYNFARDYDATVGRYLESDPIGLGGGINTYTYVDGGPVSRSDVRGLVSCNGRWVRMGEIVPTLGIFWQTLTSGACKCFWLCTSCNGSDAWSGNVYSLPSSWGRTLVIFGGNSNPGSGGIRPTPKGPSGGPSSTMGGAARCICAKPGPETGCNQCYRDH